MKTNYWQLPTANDWKKLDAAAANLAATKARNESIAADTARHSKALEGVAGMIASPVGKALASRWL